MFFVAGSSLQLLGQVSLADFDETFTDPSADWDTAVIRSLGVASITNRSTGERYQFQSNGKLLFYVQDLREDDYETQSKVTYHLNGNLKSICSYSSSCHYTYIRRQGDSSANEIPVCFSLLDNLNLLDTSNAEKLPDVGGYDTANKRTFWMQSLLVDGHRIYVYYQVNTAGEIFYLKWSFQKDFGSAKMNQSLLRSKISFDSTGVISEFVRFEQVGSEWFEQADTVTFFSFQNVNGFPRCTREVYWLGGEYDPLEKVYECFDTDGKPGVDTCYFLIRPKLSLSLYQFCFSPEETKSLDTSVYVFPKHPGDTCFYKKVGLLRDVEKFYSSMNQSYAKSFVYAEDGRITIRLYNAHCSYRTPTSQMNTNYRIDSMSVEVYRLLPDKFYDVIIQEIFTKTENRKVDCSQSLPDFDECYYFYLTHNRNSLYMDDDWINEPGVKVDTTHYVYRDEPLSKRQYRKKLKEEIETMRYELSDTSVYEVICYPVSTKR